jgi:hypothetical protein
MNEVARESQQKGSTQINEIVHSQGEVLVGIFGSVKICVYVS